MNVCLVIPPSPYLLRDRSIPWLGPLWVASCLREKGHQVSILDLTGDVNYLATATAHAAQQQVDCYGLTATLPDYKLTLEIAAALKQAHPDARYILGGAHATTAANTLLNDGWDAIVAGDGFHAAELALTTDGIVRATDQGQIVMDLDTVPFPARDLVDLNSYEFLVAGERATAVMTAFGCPMACTFCCGRDVFVYRKLRAFSPAHVLREWDTIREHYPLFTAIQDYADEWNIPPVRAIALADTIAAHPTKWLIRCFVKAEFFTEDVARAMRAAGVVEVLCGVESGSDRILKVIKKHTTSEISGAARLMAKKYGIRFKAATMVGLPTETRADALATKEWLLKYRPDDFDVTVFQPMLGSPIADRPDVEGKGLHITSIAGLPYKTVPGEYQSVCHTDELSSEDIIELRNEIDRDVRQALGLQSIYRPNEASMGQHSVMGGSC